VGIVRFLKRAVLFVGLLVFMGMAIVFGAQIYVKQTAKAYILAEGTEAPVCDAIMVLGAMVYNSGKPSPILADRLDYAYELYRLGKAKKILVSGDHGQRNYDEVKAMKEYLLAKGVPREDIFMDHAGFNTYDSMYRAKAVFCVKSLLICTQEFHIDRSVYIARKLGLEAYGYPSENKNNYNMEWLNNREFLARIKAVVDVTVKREPKFLGELIPIHGNGIVTEG